MTSMSAELMKASPLEKAGTECDVIWHDTPRLQPIPPLMEMLQGCNDHFGDPRVCEITGTCAKIKIMFYFLCG
jgi:hypothetical protein